MMNIKIVINVEKVFNLIQIIEIVLNKHIKKIVNYKQIFIA